MKKIFFFAFFLFFTSIVSSSSFEEKIIKKDHYKFKKMSIKLSNDGEWKLIGKKKKFIQGAILTSNYLAQFKDSQLSKLIEALHISPAPEYPAESYVFFQEFAFQTNGYKSCNKREEYYVFELWKSGTINCFIVRNMDPQQEIYSPIKRLTPYVDTNYTPIVLQKYFANNNIILPKMMLRSDHYHYSKKGLFAFHEMINPEINGAPRTEFTNEKDSEYYPSNIDKYPKKKDFYLNWIKVQSKKHLEFEKQLKLRPKTKLDLARYIGDGVIKEFKDISSSEEEIKIAKKEPKKKEKKVVKKEKKKKKVAKVEEPKQEEFKPEEKDIDKDAPVIKIAEAITVNDASYEIEGKVTDKAKKIFVEVDGVLVDVNDGKFMIKGYSPVDKEISIEAIDGYGNRSKPKLVKIIIDIKDTVIAEKLEPLDPTKIKAEVSENKVALIIGIENYTEAPKANYANLDGKYFFDYARKAFGIKKQNINLLINEDATFVKTSKALSLWLRAKVKPEQSDLIIFFAGHGLASTNGKDLYLLPQDGDPNLLDITALSRTKLFQTIIDLKPKSVTMFLDACYSGVSRDEQMLLASARPVRILADEQSGIPDNFTIFTASKLDQISSGLKEANHGIFSYYLMKGLEGKADSNKDKKITNGELLSYMDQNVSQKAAELGRQQNPSLAGDPEKTLITYQ
mgnify:CR=1 FL=1